MQIFDSDQQHYIAKGIVHQQILRNTLQEAVYKNKFRENFICSSVPGLGKSFEMNKIYQALNPNDVVLIEGSSGIYAFIIDIVTAVYLAQGRPLTIIQDDCDVLFEDKNLNMAKKMFDQTRKLIYGKNARHLKGFCTDLQWQAIESFLTDDRAGFSVDLSNVTFIILTNRHLPTINEVEAQDAGTRKDTRFTDLYAIRRRTKYKEIAMDNQELWGYVANVVLNEKICEKFIPQITQQQKEQILTWCWSNWSNVSERNLSLIEKMTKDMDSYPSNYVDIWKSEYL
jgi:hypothetical protein